MKVAHCSQCNSRALPQKVVIFTFTTTQKAPTPRESELHWKYVENTHLSIFRDVVLRDIMDEEGRRYRTDF